MSDPRYQGSFDVVGAQGPLTFFGSLAPARLAHGYLFTGAPGIGKKTFARRLAQSLLCERPKTTLLGYCNACSACTLFRAGTHPDFVESTGDIKIGSPDERSDELTSRELVRLLSLHGYSSRYRVVLLGDVAFGSAAAANALLKFFEEPPSGVILILTTEAPGSLIATIRSRLVEVPFSPLTTAEIEGVLKAGGVEPEAAAFAAEVALGSITRAREVLDDDAAGLRTTALAWFSAALAGEPFDLQLDERGGTPAERREILSALLAHVRVIARDWTALTAAGDGIPLLAADLRSEIAKLPKRSPEDALIVLRSVGSVERMAATNVSAALVADYLRLELAPRRPTSVEA